MTTETRQITTEELLRTPDDSFRYELVRGELRKTPPAGSEHGTIAMDIGTSLNNHVKANRLGRVTRPRPAFCWPPIPTPYAPPARPS